MRPQIRQDENQLGFLWLSPDGDPIDLAGLMAIDYEPDRLPPTHLSALDDALIDIAGRFGELLGGGRAATLPNDRADLTNVVRVLDRLICEYAAAVAEPDVRGGPGVGTDAVRTARARMALGAGGPVPLAGLVDDPGEGVVPGFGRLRYADPQVSWRGARWVVESPEPDGPCFPLTLTMLLHNSSGVRKDAALDEHRAALLAVTADVAEQLHLTADPLDRTIACGAVEWLLYDWLMAHRQANDSPGIQIHSKFPQDATMIVESAAVGVRCRTAVLAGHLDLVPLFAS
jgi:hypothetical protein